MQTLTVHYRAWNGAARAAYVLVPDGVGPRHAEPLALVISPHGRGVDAATNVKVWGDLPDRGRFAVINPEGQGRTLELYSWGYRRQIDDLLRMPAIVRETLPWFRVAPRRVYAIGGSMGGQETLLVVARQPGWLAGAAAFDSPTDMPRRYRDFPRIPGGAHLQELAREEIGGTPDTNPVGYALRSPIAWARRIAFSNVPLQLWWSDADQIVVDQAHQSQAFYDRVKQLNPHAPVTPVTGHWRHSAEFRATTQLPQSLEQLGLLAV
jgi:poly(3-hydroxybutyrate) depolymerase